MSATVNLTPEQKRAWKILRPVLVQVLELQLEEEKTNPLVGEISLAGYHAGVVQAGRIELCDELLPYILDPAFGEAEPEPKRTVPGVPFKRK